MRTEEEIDIKDVFYTLIKGYKVILSSIIIFILLAWFYTAYISFPDEDSFSVNATMVIHSEQVKVVDGEMIMENVISLSQRMVNTYQVILLSDSVLEKVNNEQGTNIPPPEMREWISVTSPKDSEVLMVTVEHSDPELAAGIANSMMEVAPEVISSTVEVGTVNVVDYAKVPEDPDKVAANYPLNLSVASVLGFMLGTFIVFFFSYLTPKVRNGKDIVEVLSLNLLGEITHSDRKSSNIPLITDEKIERHFVESFKITALNVLHNCAKFNYKNILVTSAGEKEGKTTVVSNLAMALAQTGKSVLLLECDFYNFNHIKRTDEGRKCLVDVLKGSCHYKEVLIRDSSGLHILPSKGGSIDQSELINSQQMKELIKTLEKEYDLIIMDTPPLFALSDAAFLARQADSAILVVRQEQEITENIISSRDTLLSLEVDIMGCILNDIRYTIPDKKYMDKYRFDYDSYYSGGRKRDSTIFSMRNYKVFFWCLLVVWIFVIGFFATRTGDQLVQMNENTMHFIFESMDRAGFLEDRIDDHYQRMAGITIYGEEIEYWGGTMEHWIHSILFFILALISLEIMRLYGLGIMKKAGLTLILSMVILIGNELYQSFVVHGRAYEFRDVVFGGVGIMAALVTFLSCEYFFRYLKKYPPGKRIGAIKGSIVRRV